MIDQAERLRNIVKANQAQVAASKQGTARLFTVTSGKVGVGKSNTAINLAYQMKKLGRSVIIFDADFGLANVEVMLGAIPKYTLSDLIYRGKKIEDILMTSPMGIQFISGGSGVSELSNLTKDHIQYLVGKLTQLENMADIIIVDTGAGVSDAVMEFVKASGDVLLVTTPEPTSITDSYALLKVLKKTTGEECGQINIQLLANRVNEEEEGRQLYTKLNTVSGKFLGIQLGFLGMVPYDMHVSKAVMQQKPVSMVYENSRAAQAYEKIARKLLEEDDSILHPKPGIAQVFMNIFRSRAAKR
jgi:flagellar biosynthesis protein FlhG